MKNEKGAEAPQSERRDKDTNYFNSQYQIVYNCFAEYPKTMRMAERDTGVRQNNITWYVNTMKRNGQIKLIKNDKCHVTNRKADFYQTNASIAPMPYETQPCPFKPDEQLPKSTVLLKPDNAKQAKPVNGKVHSIDLFNNFGYEYEK